MTYNVLKLAQFPQYRVFASLYKDVDNHQAVMAQIRDGTFPKDLDVAFLNAGNIISVEQLYSVLFRCFVDRKNGKMHAKTIHNELLSDISPLRNIAEAFAKFGIPSKEPRCNLVVLRVTENASEDFDLFAKNLDRLLSNGGLGGSCVTDATLEETTDLQLLKANYKLGDVIAEDRDRLNRLIIGVIQLRGL